MSNLAPGLSERFINLKDKRPIEVWEDLWQEEKTPWDRGVHNPALEDVLVQKSDILESAVVKPEGQEKLRKKALVPGCGRGVDCFLLASFGYDTYGLEYSTTALEACRKEAAKYGDTVKPRDPEIGSGKVVFLQGDFFEDEWLKGAGLEEGCFDLIYDYTFFCALNPSLRPGWALRHSQLLAPSPRGHLICIEFPTMKDPALGGPPFASTPEAYLEHLNHPGEHIPYDDKGNVQTGLYEKVSDKGFIRIAHWQPEHTHEVGKDADGTVRDWISIWRHQ
ncbi:putative methyl halide transferase [Microsporum audouinii]